MCRKRDREAETKPNCCQEIKINIEQEKIIPNGDSKYRSLMFSNFKDETHSDIASKKPL